MIRATTNGVLKTYRSNLNRSTLTLNKARNTVLSQRVFSSYAEDPATASEAFRLRRSFLRTNSQIDLNQSAIYKYEAAYSALESVVNSVDNEHKSSAFQEVLEGLNDPTGAGRAPLGQAMTQLADNIVQTMNCKYGDAHVFAGADGLNVPFTWKENKDDAGKVVSRTLCYRGIPVDSPEGSAALDQLKYLDKEEAKYQDIGLGLQEAGGELIPSSAFNTALQGISFLGYGVDKDGDPVNIVSIIDRAGTILSNCDDDGYFASDEEQAELSRLLDKFKSSAGTLKEKHVEQSAEGTFLKNNLDRLKDTSDTLNEQFLGLEQCDLADAITSFAWAQYCYNAALKVGNSILSESLMDYIAT